MSLELQRAFGLRREESIKLRPAHADQGDRLVLQGSWTKGGRPREIPIRTAAQRALLDQAKALAKRGLADPAHKSYVAADRYEYWTRQAGLPFAWAAACLCARPLSGAGGRPLPGDGRAVPGAPDAGTAGADYDARVIISSELGHSREAITAAYLGR